MEFFRTIAGATVLMLLVMTLFEFLKSGLFPGLSMRESHVLTILFSGLLAILVACRGLSRQEKLCQAIAEGADRQTEIARILEEKSSLLRDTLESTADGILVVSLENRILAYNRQFHEMWNIPESVMHSGDDGQVLQFVLDQLKFPERFLKEVHRLYTSPETVEREELEFRDGRIFERYSRPQVRNQEIRGRVWSFRDITEKRRNLEKIEMLVQTVRCAPECISITDMNDQVLFANDAFLRTYGYAESEIVGQKIYRVRSPKNQEGSVPDILARTKIDGRWEGELWNRRKDGSDFPIHLSTSIIRNDTGQPIALLGIARDISGQRESEERMRQAQKMESVGILAGGVAHDFNNLLQAMMGRVALAMGSLPSDHPGARHLEKAMDAGTRAAHLTAQLLAYSGRGKLEARPLHLGQWIQENLSFYISVIPKRVHLHAECTENLPNIEADPTQIQQVLMSLILNAAEAIGDRPGQINITVGVTQIQDRNSPWEGYGGGALALGNYVSLEVADDGCGIDEGNLPRIFDPFFTTKFTGRGLGLAAVLGIIRSHQGGIAVRSKTGEGARFLLVFPAMAERLAPALPVESAAPRPKAASVILLIDDEEMVRDVVAASLDLQGWEVLAAHDGRSGIEKYRQEGRRIDLVMLDHSMPDLNGEQVARQLKEIDPGVRILLCSGFPESEVTGRFQGIGLAGFIQKPFRSPKLMEMIHRCLP